MLFVINLLKRYFPILFLGAFVVGMIFPSLSVLLNPLVLVFVMGVMILNFVSMDFTVLSQEIRQWPYQLYLVGLKMMVIPATLAFVSMPLFRIFSEDESMSFGVLMIFGSSAAALTPTLATLFGGKFERTLLQVVASAFIMPLSLPLLFILFGNADLKFDLGKMVLILATLVFIPFSIAYLIKRFTSWRQKLQSHTPPVSLILLAAMTCGVTYDMGSLILENQMMAWGILGVTTTMFLMAFVVGWFLALKKDFKDRFTCGIITTWTNIGFAAGTAQVIFKTSAPMLLLTLVIGMIPWNLTLLFAQFIGKKQR